MKSLNLAVIGKDVSKSDSPRIHEFIAKRTGNAVSYTRLSVPEERFEKVAEKLFAEYDGFNVTIPYKLAIIPYLKKICGDAEVFGAVNTVKTSDRSGYNTDGLGFDLMLKNNGVNVRGERALLLGAGGAGRSVAKKLADAGADVSVYDRRLDSALAVAKDFGVTAIKELSAERYFAVINATGIGMHGTEGISPADEKLLSLCSVAVDLIYTPKKSRFLEIAESLGKKAVNGEAMLFYQAYYSECVYFGLAPDGAQAKKLFKQFTEESV